MKAFEEPLLDVGVDRANSRLQNAVTYSAIQKANEAASAASSNIPSSSLSSVATSGSYNDLSNKPTIPAPQQPSDWNATSGVTRILNKPTLAPVATSGNASDLTPYAGATGSRPASPAVGTMYFDSTLGKPVWWKGSGWVLADGSAA